VSVVANVAVNVDARQANQNLQQLQRQSTAAANSIEKTGRSAASASANIQRFGIAFRSVIAPVVAITGAVNILSRSLRVLGERQADAAALENGLRKIGGTRSDLRQLQQVADQLGKQTLFNQEDFDRGFALLTSFQSIAIGSYERVAKAAADVAQVTKQDVNSSLLQLAKALQDPEKGLTALARSGTQFTEAQKDLIKSLVESGKQAEAQDYILREIEKQYGNAAAAAGSAGYAGAVDSLQESFRDFQERLATGVEPAVIGTLKALTDLFDLVSKIPKPVGNAALAIGAVATAVIGLRAAIVAVLPVAKALLAFALANPWIALAAGITAAAVALAGYRSEAEKVAGAARTGTPADVAAARNLAVQKGQSISLLEARRGQATGRERASIDRQITKLRREQTDLLDAARQNALDNIADPLVTTPDGAGGGESEKDKKAKDKAAEEEKRLLARIRGLQIETEGTKQLALIKEKIAEAEMLGNDELAIRLKGEERNQQILLDYQKSLEGVTDQREQQALLVKTLAELEAAGIETAIDLEKQRLEVIKEQNKEFFKRAGLTPTDKMPGGAGAFDPSLPDLRVSPAEQQMTRMREELEALTDPINVAVNGANAIGTAFAQAFQGIVSGSQTAQEALASAFSAIGQAFVQMASEIIAQQIAMITFQTILKILGGGGSFSFGGQGPVSMPGGGGFAEGFNLPGLLPTRANGGPTKMGIPYLVGERGPELFVPGTNGGVMSNSDLRSAMGTAPGASNGPMLNMTFQTTNIGGVEYVSRDQLEAAMVATRKAAANDGAKRGTAATLSKLQNSPSTRAKLGLR
jgi:hypothetical protein